MNAEAMTIYTLASVNLNHLQPKATDGLEHVILKHDLIEILFDLTSVVPVLEVAEPCLEETLLLRVNGFQSYGKIRFAPLDRVDDPSDRLWLRFSSERSTQSPGECGCPLAGCVILLSSTVAPPSLFPTRPSPLVAPASPSSTPLSPSLASLSGVCIWPLSPRPSAGPLGGIESSPPSAR
ncbi:hypothetical protein Cgig2_017735 [Carnegiea gigantea]|uniref:Uncharacterized protein n=1 Tax=Carnegiea gigantea TaxID=171969 RepID=A0A9Q1JGW7_9CARY|nr:hypothetical protein Cgig2_017735 [Carnegiea gigantea]